MKAPKATVISLRVTDEEHGALLFEAKVLGLTVSEFLRRACATEIAVLRRERLIRHIKERPQIRHALGTTHGNVDIIGTPTVTYVYE